MATTFVLAAAVLSAVPADAQITPYGSGVNPPGSLALISGMPGLGSTFVLGVKNTAVSDAPVGLALLSLATAPAPGFPAGLVLPGLGMSGPGEPGELLLSALSPDPLITLGPVFWFGGTAAPAAFPLTIPLLPALSGITFYCQGGVITPTYGYAIGLTNGLALTIGAPTAGLVHIQPGTFQMGSDAPSGPPYVGHVSTQPAHQVTLSKPFWMGRHEVTQAEYEALMGTNPSAYVGGTRPVDSVSWFDAVAYCDALNAQQAAMGTVPPGYQYRLPTEAEWEYACRAGTTTEFHYGSAILCDQARFWYSYHSTPPANCDESSGSVPVGSYAPNAWGLHDMHGNVFEWCLDSLSSYTASPKTDPLVVGGSVRVVRGGAWYVYSDACRSAYRGNYSPEQVVSSNGFRVVLAPILIPSPSPDPAGFALIPPGTFSMGSDAPDGVPYYGEFGQSQPVHQVTISKPFWMGRHEVTQAEYQALMGFNPSQFLGPDRPVDRVSWFNAVAYCIALNAQESALGKVPSGYQYRLPTEAEWEYACRAGTTTEFHYGPALFCDQARFSFSYHTTPAASCNTPSGTVAVGSYAPNAWGLHDMHGNVLEWCLDSWSPYTASAKTDPFTSGGPDRALRGGRWFGGSDLCRSAYRDYSFPDNADGTYGFRVVLAPILVP